MRRYVPSNAVNRQQQPRQAQQHCSSTHKRPKLLQTKLQFGHSTINKANEQTRIGSEHECIIIERWPADVTFIERSFFSVTRPFPVANQTTEHYGWCGCTTTCRALNGESKDGCINVATCTVCDDFNCSAGSECGNRFRPQFALNIFNSAVGYGAVTEESVAAGAFVVEYVGELLYGDDAAKRSDSRYLVKMRTKIHHRNLLFVDARYFGNGSRFINHSCEPNCELQEWTWGNTARLGIFALHSIAALTELSFSYQERGVSPFQCECRARSCVSKQV